MSLSPRNISHTASQELTIGHPYIHQHIREQIGSKCFLQFSFDLVRLPGGWCWMTLNVWAYLNSAFGQLLTILDLWIMFANTLKTRGFFQRAWREMCHFTLNTSKFKTTFGRSRFLGDLLCVIFPQSIVCQDLQVVTHWHLFAWWDSDGSLWLLPYGGAVWRFEGSCRINPPSPPPHYCPPPTPVSCFFLHSCLI